MAENHGMQPDGEAPNAGACGFLEEAFGVTARREPERAVRDKVAQGRVVPDARPPVRAEVWAMRPASASR